MIPLGFHNFRVFLVLWYCILNVYCRNVEFESLNKIEEPCRQFCESDSCQREASILFKSMNQDIDPCDNFYEFVCGKFVNETKLNDQDIRVDAYTILQNEVATDLYREIIEEIKQNELNAFIKAKTFYQNCMNENHIEKEGNYPILDVLEKIGGWPLLLGDKWNETKFNRKESINTLIDERLILNFPLHLTVDIDEGNSSNHILQLSNSATVVGENLGANFFQVYESYIFETAVALGANPYNIHKEIRKIYEFEYHLYAGIILNSKVQESRMTIKELSEKFPSIPWLELFGKILQRGGISLDYNEMILVQNVKFISDLEKLLKKVSEREFANYLAWRVVQYSLPYLSNEFRNIDTNFWNAVKNVNIKYLRNAICTHETFSRFSIGISAIYVKKYFNKNIKSNVSEIVQNIMGQVEKHFQKAKWLDSKTRKYALAKLEAMDVNVAYSDELLNDQKVNEYYSDLEIVRGNYFKSILNITSFLSSTNFKNLRKPVNKNDWTKHQNSVVVNSYYMPRTNTYDLPAAFLRGVFFELDRPQYLNYGALGFLIGHEIIHGFDSTGRHYDKNGNWRDWWDASTLKKFKKRSMCMINQYSNFEVKGLGVQIDGILTLGENIADNGGIKAAYFAYNDWVNRSNISEACLPNLNYTPRQMFWISAARSKCSKMRLEFQKYLVQKDPHPPNEARVLVTFSNVKQFAEDFQCKVGSRMNPAKKCHVW